MNKEEEHAGLLHSELLDASQVATVLRDHIRRAHSNACYCNELARLLIEPLIGEMATIKNKLDAILKGVGE
jgi:hypothetical protein